MSDVFFHVFEGSLLCGECGALITTRHSVDRTLMVHRRSAAHKAAAEARAYRHRDDTPHSAIGPIGCHVCAVLRRDARETPLRGVVVSAGPEKEP